MKILKNSDKSSDKNGGNDFPLLPLREMVIFPGMIISFYVGRKESIEAVNLSNNNYGKKIFLTTQKDSSLENPGLNDIYMTGVIAEIKKINPGPDKKIIKITVSGLYRADIVKITESNNIKITQTEKIPVQNLQDSIKSEKLLNNIVKDFKKFISMTKISADIVKDISESENEDMLINLIMPTLKASIDKKISMLEEKDIVKRLTMLNNLITDNIEMLYIDKKINFEVKRKIDKSQKEFYLNEQMKEIQKELGGSLEDEAYSESSVTKKLDEIKAPSYVRDKALKEQKRLLKIPALSPEAGVIRTYIDTFLELPWGNGNDDNTDLKKAKVILDEQHYALKKVKTRILEFLAVRQLNAGTKGPILCFVGPPGTGKTSLGKSVAKSIGRDFIRISLGGVRDEAEIRGHRRTYLGALPGKIIQSMKKVKSNNPVFLLDEIDKMSSDFRGDPASALLEVLDPEQNNQFVDHYLEIPYDLSKVMFITTANSKQQIPYPLLDRMEIIYISSYTEIEKLNIAKNFLIPKEKKENGINNIDLNISDKALMEIIRSYTLEAGVRSLQRQIAQICRKIAKSIVLQNKKIEKIMINRKNLNKFLGKKKFLQPEIDQVLDIGVSHGLAWSEFGGSILPIEVVLYQGTGKIILTGKLGEIMKESAQTAFSFIRANSHLFDIKIENFHKDYDVHIHFPEGAIPKDGPSAGIAITCGILSALTKLPVASNAAMTGEITLTGKVLPIGGLQEKALAAVKHKKTKIIIPRENEKDMLELPKLIKDKAEFILVKRAIDVIKLVFDESVFIISKSSEDKKNPSASPASDQLNSNFDNIAAQ